MEEVLTIEKVADTGTDVDGSARVILFNDDWHTFDEVIAQIIKAIRCSFAEAERMAYTVHHKGKCVVYRGPWTECLNVSAVLEEIDLKTAVEFS
ncbi:MAG: ATP-dependent Clp protease adaptor ClpS [Chitinophagales bacterium]|nr:ATP-dependent Clp protease adaptor ClpS [Chitinophagales bacterium]MDW8428202.1 ATP-dependent Clp protease adaptor ClpS [Chitinophagales bacterium]